MFVATDESIVGGWEPTVCYIRDTWPAQFDSISSRCPKRRSSSSVIFWSRALSSSTLISLLVNEYTGHLFTVCIPLNYEERTVRGPIESTKEPCQLVASRGPCRKQWARIFDSPTRAVAGRQRVRISKVKVRARDAKPLRSYS